MLVWSGTERSLSTVQLSYRLNVSSSAIFALHAGQCRTEAEVNAVSERNVLSEVTTNIELIRLGVDTFVAPGRAREQQHL